MPLRDFLVTETSKQCIQPAASQVIRRILQMIGYDNFFTVNNNLFIESDDLRPSNMLDEDNNIRTQDNRCDVTIVSNNNPYDNKLGIFTSSSVEGSLLSQRLNNENYPLFTDKRTKLYITEISEPTTIELKFVIKVKDIEKADDINQKLISKNGINGVLSDFNQIAITYGIPSRLILLLYNIYNLQDDFKTLKLTFPDYLRIGSSDRIVKLANRFSEAKGFELVFRQTQSKVLGIMDYKGDAYNKDTTNETVARYIIDFSYFFQFAQPKIVRVDHPLVVFNKLINSEFHYTNSGDMSYGTLVANNSNRSVNKIFATTEEEQKISKMYSCIQYPSSDNWNPQYTLASSKNCNYNNKFIGIILAVNDTNNKLTVSANIKTEIGSLLDEITLTELLRVIDKYYLDPSYEKYKQYMFLQHNLFNISIFENDHVIPAHCLNIDALYNITLDYDIDITKVYRIVIQYANNFRFLDEFIIYDALENSDFYMSMIKRDIRYLIEQGFVEVITPRFSTSSILKINYIRDYSKIKDIGNRPHIPLRNLLFQFCSGDNQ